MVGSNLFYQSINIEKELCPSKNLKFFLRLFGLQYDPFTHGLTLGVTVEEVTNLLRSFRFRKKLVPALLHFMADVHRHVDNHFLFLLENEKWSREIDKLSFTRISLK